MVQRHLDEVRGSSIDRMLHLVTEQPGIRRVVLIEDVFGQFRVVLWAEPSIAESTKPKIDSELKEIGGCYWTSEVWMAEEGTTIDRELCERAWNEAVPVRGSERVRIADRHRNRGGWFRETGEPLWPVGRKEGGVAPPIVVFYSFKGGVGRSTALASFAIQRARVGERVAVVDFDLDAPGVGVLLASDESGTTAAWGVLDYLLERPCGEVDLRDYHHVCRRSSITGRGEILVFPAGNLNEDYIGKLARVDLEPSGTSALHAPLVQLLDQIRVDLTPDWLLLDARTGLSESTGILLSGLAHLHVLFGTTSEQNWRGLRIILDRLGAERVLAGRPQLECLLVQSLVPDHPQIARLAIPEFADRARDEFSDHYYALDPEDPSEDQFWYVRDLEDADAPHSPVAIPYLTWLSHFTNLDEVADKLADLDEYRTLATRITERFLGA